MKKRVNPLEYSSKTQILRLAGGKIGFPKSICHQPQASHLESSSHP
jgi:hypothetical protein